MGLRLCLMVLVLHVAAGCAALSDDMGRAEEAFKEARYEDVEIWLDALEKDVADMDLSMRVRYYYLRGTTAFRLRERSDARHFLALAKEEAADDPSLLEPERKRELARMLKELEQPEGSGDEATDGDA